MVNEKAGIFDTTKCNIKKSRKKCCVVFDCSSEYKGEFISKSLLTSPDLANKLTCVLIRFLQEVVAFRSDIEEMFHQVISDKRLLTTPSILMAIRRYENKVKTYRTTVHLCEAASLPGYSNFLSS